MSCCGKNRAQIAPTRHEPSERPASELGGDLTRAHQATITVEYRGKGLLIVAGPITNRRYVFLRTGQRVAMDARDRDLTRTFVNLRLVPNP